MALFGNVTEEVKGPVNFNNQVSFSQGVGGAITPGAVYYVDRSKDSDVSGNGRSWKNAFLTLTEAITAVNADYTNATSPSEGRNRWIFVSEGWYAELPQTLSASDVTICGVAPGSHDSIVIYGVPVAGTFSGTAGGPTLTLGGSNCTVMNMGFYCSDPLYGAIRDGANASDADVSAVDDSYNNKIINCNFVRDTADGELCGIDVCSNEGPVIDGCSFSTSCKDSGIRIRSNGVTNPVNVIIKNCRFTGTPIGVDANAGHNCIVSDCVFMDDTTDRPDTIDAPVDSTGATNTAVYNCYSEFSNANILVGGTSPLSINNFLLATPA